MIAGDISPIDVITHLPVFCEDRDVPYIFVPSKEVQPEQVHALSSKLAKLSGTPAASRGEDATTSWHKGSSNSRPLQSHAQELGAAAMTKRPTSCMLLLPKPAKPNKEDTEEEAKEYADSYTDVHTRVKAVQPLY